METRVLSKTDLGIKVKVVIAAAEFEQHIESAYEKNKAKYTIAGFRKGKVPRAVIEKNYGADVFIENAVQIAVSENYVKFLDNNKDVTPFTYPQIEVQKADKSGLEFTFEIPFAPSAKLGAYKGLKVKKATVSISEAEIEAELKREQAKHARFEKTNDKAKVGDIVNIDFKGFVDGKAFDRGEAQGFDLELGSNSFIPGFEAGLVGLKAGDNKDVVVTFPKEYQAKALAGKEATFKCKINEVKQKHLPKLDDAFAKDASEFNTLADFKASIKRALSLAKEKTALAQTEQAIVDKIIEKAQFNISPIVVQEECNYLLNDLAQKLSYQGLTLEKYCDYVGTNVENFRKDKLIEAEKIIKMRLVFREIINAEKIEATEADIIKCVIAAVPSAKLDEKGAKDYYSKMGEQKKEAVKNDALMQKLLSFLVAENL